MSIPIVFIHQGDSFYLKYALLQAKLSNPHCKVFLIGDEANRKYNSSYVEHAMISDYDEDVGLFASLYQHIGPNSPAFEAFCIQRLFILRNFMARNELMHCCCQDSDVLLFMDVSERNFQECDIIFNHRGMNNLDTLRQFCSMILDHYSERALFERIEHFLPSTGCPGISDMVLMDYYNTIFPNEMHMLASRIDRAYFCGNINIAEDFETIYDRKKVYRIDGNLYCKHMPSGAWVRMNSFHFQGADKMYMEPFFLHNFHYRHQDVYYFDYASALWQPV
ncbi:hypothetical protein [Paenibacillus humicola]|uniref:hypothetical protein n=1 Tax=Paenibacillus humicola TaxID=3110540 RepID=UPI00237AB6AC|nr:hypothetical protein [Paenibacillus humicola]